jgi:hypothetical protein
VGNEPPIDRLALVTALAFLAGNSSQAQDIPRTANGKPDFSGIYTPPSTVNATGPRGNLIFNADKMAPVKPGAESLLYHSARAMFVSTSRAQPACRRASRRACSTSCRSRSCRTRTTS